MQAEHEDIRWVISLVMPGQSPLNCVLSRLDGDGVFSSSGVHKYSNKPKCQGVPVSWHFFMIF